MSILSDSARRRTVAVVASFRLRLFAIGEARALAECGGFIPNEALLGLSRPSRLSRHRPFAGASFHARGSDRPGNLHATIVSYNEPSSPQALHSPPYMRYPTSCTRYSSESPRDALLTIRHNHTSTSRYLDRKDLIKEGGLQCDRNKSRSPIRLFPLTVHF